VAHRKKNKNKRDKRLLLSNLAQILDACEQAGIKPKLKHGIVFTEVGYVLPIGDRWVARSLKPRN
jgi:hypothetical protein